MSIILVLIIAIICLVLAFILIDLCASAIGGDARLWLLIKICAVLLALWYVVGRTGFL